MPKRKEKALEDYFEKRVKETRGITRKMAWPGRRGAPDRWAGWPHLKFNMLIELKEQEQDWGLQDHQQREIDKLIACGMIVYVVDTKERLEAIFRYHGIK